MPNIKSSKKAVKVIAKKTDNNHELKARVKNLIKNCDLAIKAGDKEKADSLFNEMKKNIDHAVSKGLIKSNTSARQKSRLSNKIKNMK
jgi:small subunit ribosomal protein S20